MKIKEIFLKIVVNWFSLCIAIKNKIYCINIFRLKEFSEKKNTKNTTPKNFNDEIFHNYLYFIKNRKTVFFKWCSSFKTEGDFPLNSTTPINHTGLSFFDSGVIGKIL